ncbi:MAG: LysR family transcriptional regulator [Bacillota bacterium]
MRLDHVEAFLMLADERHFGRAAQRLAIGPSQMTRRIQELERWIGTPLFVRTSRRVDLTFDGSRLHDDVRRDYDALTDSLRRARMRARAAEGELLIGFTEAIIAPEIDEILAELKNSRPECTARLVEVPILSQLSALLDGEVDALIGWTEAAGKGTSVAATICRRSRCVAVATEHPLATHSAVTVEELADHLVSGWGNGPLLERMRLAFCPDTTPTGRPIRRGGPVVRTLAELANAVALGEVIHPTIEGVTMFEGHPGIRLVPLSDMEPLHLGLIVRAAPMNTRVAALVTVARDLERRTAAS